VSVGLILDASALLAHVRLERLSVGELIGEVSDSDDVTGIPALAVLDVLPQVKGADRQRLEALISGDSRTTVMLPLLADGLVEVERVAALIPGVQGAAHAIVLANKHGVLLATTDPQSLGIGVVIHEDDICELS
jgi:hypothetical protein